MRLNKLITNTLKFPTFCIVCNKRSHSECFLTGKQHPISVIRAKLSEVIQNFDANLVELGGGGGGGRGRGGLVFI